MSGTNRKKTAAAQRTSERLHQTVDPTVSIVDEEELADVDEGDES